MLKRMTTLCVLLALAGCAHEPPGASRERAQVLLAQRGLAIDWAPPPGQDALPKEPLTPDDAVRIGLRRNAGLRATLADLDIAVADYEATLNGAAPRLTLAWRDSSTPGAAAEWTIGIADQLARWLLWRPNRRAADADLDAARWHAAAEVQALAEQIERAWYRCAAAQQRDRLEAQQLELASAAAELAERFFAAGNISAAEHDLRVADVALPAARAADARVDATEARAALGRLMGLGPDADWSLAVESGALPGREVETLPLETMRAAARSNRLDLGEARARVAAAAERARHAGFRAVATDTEIGLERTRDVDRSRLLGPQVSLPVPGFGTGSVAARRAAAEWRRARSQLELLELAVDYGVDSARQRHEVARQRVLRWRDEALPALRRRVDARQREQNFMLIGPFDLIEDRARVLAAERELADAVHAYWDTRIELERVVGARMSPAERGRTPPPADAQPMHPDAPMPVADPPSQPPQHH